MTEKTEFETELHKQIKLAKFSLEHLAEALQGAIEGLDDMQRAKNPRSRLNSRRKLTGACVSLAMAHDRVGQFLIDNDLQRGFGIMPTGEMDALIAAMNSAPPSEVRH